MFEDIDVKIRRMDQGDIIEILQIQEENGLSSWSKADYEKELSNSATASLSLIYAGKVCGFIIARLIIIPNHNDQANEAEIINFAVKKTLQNRGFGQLLFKLFSKELLNKNIKTVWLEVRKSNKQAIKFYTKNGYTIEFERKNYYTNPPEDAFVMKKIISIGDFTKIE